MPSCINKQQQAALDNAVCGSPLAPLINPHFISQKEGHSWARGREEDAVAPLLFAVPVAQTNRPAPSAAWVQQRAQLSRVLSPLRFLNGDQNLLQPWFSWLSLGMERKPLPWVVVKLPLSSLSTDASCAARELSACRQPMPSSSHLILPLPQEPLGQETFRPPLAPTEC